MPVMDRLLDPVEVSSYFLEYWEQRPLFIHRDAPEFYGELASTQALEHVLDTTELRHPCIRLVKNQSVLPAPCFAALAAGKYGDLVIQPDRVLGHYHEGATIIFDRFDRYRESLRNFRTPDLRRNYR